MRIATNIKTLREQKGMTQQEFANLLGVSREVLAKYETNWRIPKFETALQIAKVLNIKNCTLNASTKWSDSSGHLLPQERSFRF